MWPRFVEFACEVQACGLVDAVVMDGSFVSTAPDARVYRAAEGMGGGVVVCLAGPVSRMSRDYEYLTTSSEAFTYAAMSRLMLRRLTQQKVRER